MALLLTCDSCGYSTPDMDSNWLVLRRREATLLSYAMQWQRTPQNDPDPILGHGGLTFHSYDCLRVWLIATDSAVG